MPTYEYQCFACGHVFEAVQRMSDEALKTCPECHKDELKRLISATAFHLKGTGWYKTDYGSSGSGGHSVVKNGGSSSTESGESTSTADKPAATTSTETKTETKSDTPSDTK